MKIYLVGGAVRDRLLNIPVFDQDWVVVGARPADLLAMGYQQVGKDFPVFLHPYTHEEYALARTERKSGSGYTGFTCCTAANITLAEDLLRRDLTINAIASSSNGTLIDPYQGIADLQARVLRHVSSAFTEDPLRVLRVARFAARFAYLGFSIAEETLKLMRYMTHSGELMVLTRDRVWQETEKAMLSQHPHIYFQVLRECDALEILFPEINALFGIPSLNKQCAAVDTGTHTMMTLSAAAQLSLSLEVRFSALCHDLGKGLTPQEQWPLHYGHEISGVRLVEELCQRLRTPNPVRNLAKLVAKYHDVVHAAHTLRPKTLLKLFDAIDVWRNPQRLKQVIIASTADIRGYIGCEDLSYPQGDYLCQAYQVAKVVSIKEIVANGLRGEAIRNELISRRKQALADWRHNQNIN